MTQNTNVDPGLNGSNFQWSLGSAIINVKAICKIQIEVWMSMYASNSGVMGPGYLLQNYPKLFLVTVSSTVNNFLTYYFKSINFHAE